MTHQSWLALLLVLSLLVPVASQQKQSPAPAPPSPQQAEDERDDVVRITTNLVQIDAVVTDRTGKQVTSLTPEDFEIYENGKQQEIKNFTYVANGQPAAALADAATIIPQTDKKAARKNVMLTPPVRLRPEQVRRTIALVVDDLGLSFESMHFVRDALRKFVDEQMQPGDLVAITRTGAGIGALQQFTSDKRLLYAAIDRVRFNMAGRAGIGYFSAITDEPLNTYAKRPQVPGSELGQPLDNPVNKQNVERDVRQRVSEYRDEIFSVGTLGALNFIIRGLRELPGRKSVVLMSDSLSLFEAGGQTNSRLLDSVRHLTDLSNRASVVIYTIDARGLQTLNLGAQDQLSGIYTSPTGQNRSGIDPRATAARLDERTLDFLNSQSGLNYLADQTGGFFVQNNNDINLGIRRVLEDQRGYYLIGYRPDEATFDPISGQRHFNKIEVKVKRPGLAVRTRTGFFGITDEQARPVRNTARQQLMAAITSPFASGAIDLRLTSLFLNDPTYGSFVRSLIYVDGQSLKFTEEADGSHKAAVDVVAMTFDAEGTTVDQRYRTETVVVRGSEYNDVLRDGLIFGINLPVKKAGAFQLRIAVRDANTQRVGAANQFIEVPNLTKNRLTLSGMYVASSELRRTISAATNTLTSAPAVTARETPGTEEGKIGEVDPQAGPAVRRFRPGTTIDYGYEVYNAQLDKQTRRPQLQTQLRLFRDNKPVFSGKVISISGPSDSKRLVAFGHLKLGENLTPGEYVLHVVVTDTLAKEKQATTAQWIEFEIR